jgi:hypothetical protein
LSLRVRWVEPVVNASCDAIPLLPNEAHPYYRRILRTRNILYDYKMRVNGWAIAAIDTRPRYLANLPPTCE